MTVASTGQIPLASFGWVNCFDRTPETESSHSGVMARLTLSALERASRDPACWKDPVVHRALLVSGLSVLTEATKRLNQDLESAA